MRLVQVPIGTSFGSLLGQMFQFLDVQFHCDPSSQSTASPHLLNPEPFIMNLILAIYSLSFPTLIWSNVRKVYVPCTQQ